MIFNVDEFDPIKTTNKKNKNNLNANIQSISTNQVYLNQELLCTRFKFQTFITRNLKKKI